MHELDRLRSWTDRPVSERPIIVAAGGDGTVGAVMGYVANTGTSLGILPLGTSNDVARSLSIPTRLDDAVRLLSTGKVSTVDVGQLVAANNPPRYFVHAAAIGLNVAFAKLATQASIRKRLGRLTYIAAAAHAWLKREPLRCTLEIEGKRIPLTLLHLSIMNAPVFGGRLDLSLPGSSVDDRRLDVLAIENMPLRRIALATILTLRGKQEHARGVLMYHAGRIHVHTEQPVDVSLDGEIVGKVPGDFILAAEALCVITPHSFEDVDDQPG
jgi:YegS/Rv2252/BmrU family lipid kinase